MENINCILIIDERDQIEARTLLWVDWELSGHFIVWLSQNWNTPASHYISSWYFLDEELNKILNSNIGYRVFFGRNINEVLETENLKIINIV